MPLQPNQSTDAGSSTTKPLWNPGETLQIINPKRTKKLTYNVICVGRAARKYGARCAWAIEDQSPEHAAAAVEILNGMATRPPTEVADDQLETLTRHCLCSYHTHQIASAKEELKQRLQPEIRHHRTRTFLGLLMLFVSLGCFNFNLGLQTLSRLRNMKGIGNQTNSQGDDQGPEEEQGSRRTQGKAADSTRNT